VPTVLETEIINLYKDVWPYDAYTMGFEEKAGTLFVPSEANLAAAGRKIRALRSRASTELERKLLSAMLTRIEFPEPQPVMDDILGAIFVHLAKEGINEEHLLSLVRMGCDALDATKARFQGKKVPTGVKALALYRLDGVKGILDAVKKEVKNRELRSECDRLKAKCTSMEKFFEVKGFGHGEFKNAERAFAKYGFGLGRERFYSRALREGMDYDESPTQLERKAIAWLDDELPRYRKITGRLAKRYGCKPVPEEVEKRLNTRMQLDLKHLVRTTKAIRKVVQRFVNEDVHGINPKYRTRVIETPGYLTGTMPSGAAQFFNTFTSRPFQIFFQTTDPKRDPDRSVSALINLLVHEEYGHCVHHSNSVYGFVGKVDPLELLHTSLLAGPITEGLSFNRELEFLEASRKLETKPRLTKTERDYVVLLEDYGGLKLINMELEFWTRRWRLIRFLRVVGDVRVNSGKQGLLEFVDWANKYTGVPRSSVYFQLFPAHEGTFPGYATNYAVVGQEIREIERKIKDDKKRIRFSTYLCSIGFPPRSMYRRRLEDYAKKLG
jgi:hypothetical protein